MWCPSVSLSVWANAWLAGAAAPDDVFDALSLWAPKHSVTAYDSVAAGRTGLPWPDLNDAGAVSLLQTIRTAAGRPGRRSSDRGRAAGAGRRTRASRGTQFERDAVAAGEAVIVTADGSAPIGLVPDFEYDELDDESEFEPEPYVLSWTVYSVPGDTGAENLDLGDAEFALRSAVRSAADALGALRAGAAAQTSTIRVDSSIRRWNRRSAPGSRPRPDAGAARAGERGARRCDHRRQLRA